MIPQIFDLKRRVAKFNRAQTIITASDQLPWMIDAVAEDLVDRLAFVSRSFDRVLVIADLGAAVRSKLTQSQVHHISADDLAEGRIDVPLASFDLVIMPALLETINDLPGMLIQIHRALEPGGMFLGAFPGSGSLEALRHVFGQLAAKDDIRNVSRFHPSVDVRAAGDLLARAGFALPVADILLLERRYTSAHALINALRTMGLTNALMDQARLSKSEWGALKPALDAPIDERINFVFLTGWAKTLSDPVQNGPVKSASFF